MNEGGEIDEGIVAQRKNASFSSNSSMPSSITERTAYLLRNIKKSCASIRGKTQSNMCLYKDNIDKSV